MSVVTAVFSYIRFLLEQCTISSDGGALVAKHRPLTSTCSDLNAGRTNQVGGIHDSTVTLYGLLYCAYVFIIVAVSSSLQSVSCE